MTGAVFLLNPQLVRHKVPDATYERGLNLYLTQKVLQCDVRYSSSREWEIEGLVQGTEREPYQVIVGVEIEPNGQLTYFNGACSCPVTVNCKHAVALTLKAAYASARAAQPAWPSVVPRGGATIGEPEPDRLYSSNSPEARQKAAAEREFRLAEQKVGQWLDLFEGPKSPSGGSDGAGTRLYSPRAAPANADQVVYTLSAGKSGDHAVLQLGFGLSRLLRNGSWAKLKPVRYIDVVRTPPADLEIMRLIQTLAAQTSSYSYTSADKGQLNGETGRLALQLAINTGRLFTVTDERSLCQPVRLGPPRSLRWRWDTLASANSAEPLWALRAQLADIDIGTNLAAGQDATAGSTAPDTPPTPQVPQVPPSTPSLQADFYANKPPLYLDSASGECGPVEVPGLSGEHLALLLKAPPIPQSAFARHETALLSQLANLPLPPVLKAPTVFQGIVPTAILGVEPVLRREVPALGLLRATLRFDYNGLGIYSPVFQSPVFVERKNDAGEKLDRVMLHRDAGAERAVHATLQDLGLQGNANGEFYFLHPSQQPHWLHWAENDFAPLRQAGFTVELTPGMGDWIERADTLDVSLAAQGATGHPGDGAAGGQGGGDGSHSAWFDLSLGMQINGQRHNILPFLPELLAQLGHLSAMADGGAAQLPPFVYLAQASGKMLRLPTAPLKPWLQALLDLVGERGHAGTGDSLRLSRLEALRVGAALGQGAHWQGAQGLTDMIKQLAGHSALPEVALPSGLNAELRPYQQQGLNWLQFLRTHGLAGILADDMGLGKTLQTLAHILVEKQAGRLDRPALVIAPVSLMGNWRREAERFTPDLKVLVLHGAERHEAAAEMAHCDLVIAPYSLLKRDRDRWMQQPWHLVVLDEAQNIKNANTDAAQVVAALNTRHRLCLSGTPMENHLGELWSLFHFLMPGFLGSQARFKTLFRTPIEKMGDNERLDQLRRRVTPFMLRRAKADVATDLPPKIDTISSVELTGKQADLYETIRLTTEKAVREALADKGLAKSQIQILDALLKLRQVCCDPRLVPLAAAKKIKQSAKLELLMELLPEMLAEGRRILLFSQFTSMLELIEQELRERKLPWVKLTGQSQKRDALIEQFTSGQVPLFLISLKAGGVGLNLPQADTVIHYDPWWNPAVENQATDRAHRIGQTQSVFVYKLVAQGTIEERILALQARKAALADSLYSGAQGRKQPLFTEDDVAELLKPLS